jgi:hypothetical protein
MYPLSAAGQSKAHSGPSTIAGPPRPASLRRFYEIISSLTTLQICASPTSEFMKLKARLPKLSVAILKRPQRSPVRGIVKADRL